MIVNIKGVGNAKFPDDMPIDDIRNFLRKKFARRAIEGQTDILQPVDNIAAPVQTTLTEKLSTGIASTLKNTGVISDNFGAQRIGKNVSALVNLLPVIGDAEAGDEFGRAIAQGDGLGVGLAALGAIPIIGKSIKKPLKKVSNSLKNLRNNIEVDVLNDRIVGYNVPIKNKRSFTDDYPQTTGQHGALLTTTIDGDELLGKYVAGRRRVSGADENLGRQAIEGLGREKGVTFAEATKTSLGGFAGEIKGARTVSPLVSFDKKLPVQKQDIVKAHEIGHLIDEQADQLNLKGIKKEIESLYNELNNPFFKPGQPRKKFVLPRHDIDRELSAESIRLYLTNPNHIKDKYPNVAKKIRQLVNNNPSLNKTIQFNSALAAAILLNKEDFTNSLSTQNDL